MNKQTNYPKSAVSWSCERPTKKGNFWVYYPKLKRAIVAYWDGGKFVDGRGESVQNWTYWANIELLAAELPENEDRQSSQKPH